MKKDITCKYCGCTIKWAAGIKGGMSHVGGDKGNFHYSCQVVYYEAALKKISEMEIPCGCWDPCVGCIDTAVEIAKDVLER